MLSLLPENCDIVCTHPMFGPESGKYGWQGLPFLYEKVRVADIDRFIYSNRTMISLLRAIHKILFAESLVNFAENFSLFHVFAIINENLVCLIYTLIPIIRTDSIDFCRCGRASGVR